MFSKPARVEVGDDSTSFKGIKTADETSQTTRDAKHDVTAKIDTELNKTGYGSGADSGTNDLGSIGRQSSTEDEADGVRYKTNTSDADSGLESSQEIIKSQLPLIVADSAAENTKPDVSGKLECACPVARDEKDGLASCLGLSSPDTPLGSDCLDQTDKCVHRSWSSDSQGKKRKLEFDTADGDDDIDGKAIDNADVDGVDGVDGPLKNGFGFTPDTVHFRNSYPGMAGGKPENGLQSTPKKHRHDFGRTWPGPYSKSKPGASVLLKQDNHDRFPFAVYTRDTSASDTALPMVGVDEWGGDGQLTKQEAQTTSTTTESAISEIKPCADTLLPRISTAELGQNPELDTIITGDQLIKHTTKPRDYVDMKCPSVKSKSVERNILYITHKHQTDSELGDRFGATLATAKSSYKPYRYYFHFLENVEEKSPADSMKIRNKDELVMLNGMFLPTRTHTEVLNIFHVIPVDGTSRLDLVIRRKISERSFFNRPTYEWIETSAVLAPKLDSGDPVAKNTHFEILPNGLTEHTFVMQVKDKSSWYVVIEDGTLTTSIIDVAGKGNLKKIVKMWTDFVDGQFIVKHELAIGSMDKQTFIAFDTTNGQSKAVLTSLEHATWFDEAPIGDDNRYTKDGLLLVVDRITGQLGGCDYYLDKQHLPRPMASDAYNVYYVFTTYDKTRNTTQHPSYGFDEPDSVQTQTQSDAFSIHGAVSGPVHHHQRYPHTTNIALPHGGLVGSISSCDASPMSSIMSLCTSSRNEGSPYPEADIRTPYGTRKHNGTPARSSANTSLGQESMDTSSVSDTTENSSHLEENYFQIAAANMNKFEEKNVHQAVAMNKSTDNNHNDMQNAIGQTNNHENKNGIPNTTVGSKNNTTQNGKNQKAENDIQKTVRDFFNVGYNEMQFSAGGGSRVEAQSPVHTPVTPMDRMNLSGWEVETD